MSIRRRLIRTPATVLLPGAIAAPAYAAEARFGGVRGAASAHRDARSSRNQYYPARGCATRALPAGGIDVNAAENLLMVGVRSRALAGPPPSVWGNASSPRQPPPSPTARRCGARIAADGVAA
jgi:hypothetical protein